MGDGRGRKAHGEIRRRRALRSGAPSLASLAHDPRVGCASDRARSCDGLRGELRWHELRRAAGESARHAQVRLGADEHPRRPNSARVAVGVRLGRRGSQARRFRHHHQRDVRRLSHDARTGALARLVLQKVGTSDALARLLVCPVVGGRAVPAHAERLAAAWRQGPGLGRSHRRDRPRHRDHRRRLVLDRPAAVQRPIRRAGLLRDQGRQDRRHAQGRRVSNADARLLGEPGHGWRTEELLSRRRVRRREGTAGAGERRQPRLRRSRASATSTSSTRDGPDDAAFVGVERAISLARGVQRDRQANAVVRDGGGDARPHHEHEPREHALRRESDLDWRRLVRLRRDGDQQVRQAQRIVVDESARRRRTPRRGPDGRARREAESRGSGGDARAGSADVSRRSELERRDSVAGPRDARDGGEEDRRPREERRPRVHGLHGSNHECPSGREQQRPVRVQPLDVVGAHHNCAHGRRHRFRVGRRDRTTTGARSIRVRSGAARRKRRRPRSTPSRSSLAAIRWCSSQQPLGTSYSS